MLLVPVGKPVYVKSCYVIEPLSIEAQAKPSKNAYAFEVAGPLIYAALWSLAMPLQLAGVMPL